MRQSEKCNDWKLPQVFVERIEESMNFSPIQLTCIPVRIPYSRVRYLNVQVEFVETIDPIKAQRHVTRSSVGVGRGHFLLNYGVVQTVMVNSTI